MNSSEQPIRQIASNLLWTPRGLLRDPLVRLSTDGIVLGVETCPAPDREAGTAFFAGVLVAQTLAEPLAVLCRQRPLPETPLPEILATLATALPHGACEVAERRCCPLAVISGLDYPTLRLTPQTQIRKL